MNAKQSLLAQITGGTFALHTDDQIARKIRLKGESEKRALRGILDSLVREGALLRDSRLRYGTAEQFGAKKGTISGNERGFGFFMPEDGSGDLFLSHRALNGALHGDTVYAICTGGRAGDEGEVLCILERGYREIVGTFRRKNKQAGVLIPDERKYTESIFIPLRDSMNCPDGAKAVAEITSYPEGRSPGGRIAEILGDASDFFVEELSLIRSHRLREEFPQAVEEQAGACERRGIRPEDLAGREDVRGTLTVTVDGEDTRDIDDAISLSREGGIFLLGVHIADVTNYVTEGSALDEEAFARGTSVYFPDRVLPMLPKALSNGICSLNEGVDRLTLSCFMRIDGRGNVLSRRVCPAVIRSRHRLTYDEVTKLAEGDARMRETYPDLIDFVRDAVELTHILKDARAARGGVALDVREAKILYRDGRISIPEHRRTVSHEMIEQFMVLANESVASLMTEQNEPFVYRVHEKPSPEKAEAFRLFLGEAGIPANFDPENVTPYEYRSLLEGLKDSPLCAIVNRVMLRSMMKAKYSPDNLGHFGLASACYCHFTSPIRRYPDLCIHRIIKAALTDASGARAHFAPVVGEVARRSSECEKNATEAERDVDALYTVAYMQDKIGQEFEAAVSGVTSFGVFAELPNTVEGFIPVETLPDDSYEFFEDKFLLLGTRNSFRLGERIRIRVAGVDWGSRRTRFQFLSKAE